jgi:hypothetical protein
MKNLKTFPIVLSIVLVLACFHVSVSAQSTDDKNKLATISSNGLGVRWEVIAPHAAVTMTVSAPDGQVFRKEFQAGTAPEFSLSDSEGNRLPDGQYSYELRLTPVLSAAVKKELAASRGKGNDEAAAEREMRKRGLLPTQSLVQSGTFSILKGYVIVGGGVEPGSRRASTRTAALRPPSSRPFVQSEDFSNQEIAFVLARAVETGAARSYMKTAGRAFAHPAMPDQVIPDDLIVQSSLCVGFDCVDGESFGFDTIRLKENSTRIKFEDTSTSAGYPSNDWQLTANDSASGGANKFSIEDVTGAKVPFTITAGAATNSIFVDSTGRLGLRTSTPVLDIHANTSNTPAIRLEQNNSGGFTAQTWDVAGNEANFFVRDVTGGSRLPFRIRPGAPTSSIDINASGNVGVGTASPTSAKLVILGGNDAGTTNSINISSADGTTSEFGFFNTSAASDYLRLGYWTGSALKNVYFDIGATGRVGIGTTAPDQALSVNGDASKTGGGSWQTFSDERLKTIKGQFTSGLKALMQLQPLRYEYRRNNALGLNSQGEHVGFGAQAVQKVIPEAVTSNAQGYLLVNNDPIIWTMLNAIKEQQKEIEQLKAQIQKLQPRAGASNKTRNRRR